MDEGFQLPVTFKGEQWLFPARLVQFGYSYRIEVDIEGILVSFEKDEERNWRALLSVTDMELNKSVDRNLIQSIAESLEEHL